LVARLQRANGKAFVFFGPIALNRGFGDDSFWSSQVQLNAFGIDLKQTEQNNECSNWQLWCWAVS
jgi:hypothetical protein